MPDPNLMAQALPSLVGGLIGGTFALAGGALTAGRTARHERHRVEREDLVRLAAEMIRTSDAMWVGDVDYQRALFTLSNAERSPHHTDEAMHWFREQAAAAGQRYGASNDTMRSLAAEMRLRQPGIAEQAEALWQASMVPDRGGIASVSPSDQVRRATESEFIKRVHARIGELQ